MPVSLDRLLQIERLLGFPRRGILLQAVSASEKSSVCFLCGGRLICEAINRHKVLRWFELCILFGGYRFAFEHGSLSYGAWLSAGCDVCRGGSVAISPVIFWTLFAPVVLWLRYLVLLAAGRWISSVSLHPGSELLGDGRLLQFSRLVPLVRSFRFDGRFCRRNSTRFL